MAERGVPWDVVVVGAGFAGAVCAEVLASSGQRVLVLERRAHVGGNSADRRDAHGLLIHPYGPHIFHTSRQHVFEYLSRFTAWRPYEHRVMASVGGELYPVPVNRTTINRLYGWNLDEVGVAQYLERVRERRAEPRTSEDVVLSSVGRDLCEKFFRGYTRKQWNLDLSELAPEVAGRIPTRTNDDDRYFTDTYQFMPIDGYSRMFERMLAGPNVTVRCNVEFPEGARGMSWRHLIYTGPLDAYFGYRLGRLPYRSLRFEHEHLPEVNRYQPVGTVNFPGEHAYTRITEFKHLTGEACAGTSIVKEYPQAEGDPYYPVLGPGSGALLGHYRRLAAEERNVTFLGRLAEYRYYNMDQVVAAALAAAAHLLPQ